MLALKFVDKKRITAHCFVGENSHKERSIRCSMVCWIFVLKLDPMIFILYSHLQVLSKTEEITDSHTHVLCNIFGRHV